MASIPGGPPLLAIFLRAGWSLGTIGNIYFHENDGGDQAAGRMSCGLPITTTEFAALPPRFSPEGLAFITPAMWAELIPSYNRYTQYKFVSVLPYLIASLVFHYDWLDRNLKSNHPLKQSKFWTEMYSIKLKPYVLSGYFSCPITHMIATGVPPHLVMANAQNSRMDKFEQCQTALQVQNSDRLQRVEQGLFEILQFIRTDKSSDPSLNSNHNISNSMSSNNVGSLSSENRISQKLDSISEQLSLIVSQSNTISTSSNSNITSNNGSILSNILTTTNNQPTANSNSSSTSIIAINQTTSMSNRVNNTVSVSDDINLIASNNESTNCQRFVL